MAAPGTDNTKRGKNSSREIVVLTPEKLLAVEAAIGTDKKWWSSEWTVRCLLKTIEYQQTLGGLDDAPPHDMQLEREALYCVMVGNEQHAGIVLVGLEEMDFYPVHHQELFAAMKDGWNKGVPWGTDGALTDWLKRTGALKSQDTRHFALTCAEAMQSQGCVFYAEFYVKTLKELRERRDLVNAAKTIVQVGANRSLPLSSLRSLIEKV